jgi:hypothetical protein
VKLTTFCAVDSDETTSDSGSVVRPQVSQYEKLQILALLQPYPHDREGRDGAVGFNQESGIVTRLFRLFVL